MSDFVSAVRAELTKALTLRMFVLTAVGTMTLAIGLSWLVTRLTQQAYDAGRPEDAAGLEAPSAFLVILHYGQIGVILLGCWLLFQESDNGSLRTTFLAVPNRLVVFLAKGCVALSGSAAVAVTSVGGAYLVRCAATTCVVGTDLTGTTGGDLRVLGGVVAYWSLLGVLAFALSAAVRNGLVGLGLLLVLVLAASSYLLTLTPLARFLPDQAGAQLYQQDPPIGIDLGPGWAVLVLGAWVAAAIVAGSYSFRRWAVSH